MGQYIYKTFITLTVLVCAGPLDCLLLFTVTCMAIHWIVEVGRSFIPFGSLSFCHSLQVSGVRWGSCMSGLVSLYKKS